MMNVQLKMASKGQCMEKSSGFNSAFKILNS